MDVGRLTHGAHSGHSLEGAGEVKALENLQCAPTSLLRSDSVPCNETTATKVIVHRTHGETALFIYPKCIY